MNFLLGSRETIALTAEVEMIREKRPPRLRRLVGSLSPSRRALESRQFLPQRKVFARTICFSSYRYRSALHIVLGRLRTCEDIPSTSSCLTQVARIGFAGIEFLQATPPKPKHDTGRRSDCEERHLCSEVRGVHPRDADSDRG